MNKKIIIVFIVSILLIVCSVLFLIQNKKDRGFIQESCLNETKSLVWNLKSSPIKVYIDDEIFDWCIFIIKSIKTWNNVAENKIIDEFLYTKNNLERSFCKENGSPRDPVIFIKQLNAEDYTINPHTKLFWDEACNIKCVEIFIPKLADRDLWDKIALHEIGHALGLAHDDFEESIMYIGGRSLRDGMDKITEFDIELLKNEYKF